MHGQIKNLLRKAPLFFSYKKTIRQTYMKKNFKSIDTLKIGNNFSLSTFKLLIFIFIVIFNNFNLNSIFGISNVRSNFFSITKCKSRF